MSGRRRIAIAGEGAVTPLGLDWASTWEALLAGKRAVHPYPPEDQERDLDLMVSSVRTIRTDGKRASVVTLAQPAIAAALQRQRFPLRWYGGTNHGDAGTIVRAVRAAMGDHRSDIEPSDWSKLLEDHIPNALNANGFEAWLYAACSTGLHALAVAVTDLETLDSSIACEAIVVSVDVLSAIGAVGFLRVGAVSRKGCFPFHVDRDGLMIGEAAGAVLLRRSGLVDEPEAIGVLGIGMSCDAGHPTQPEASGRYLEIAVSDAIQRAGYGPADIAGIVLHGTGTPANDAVEAAVCERVWGPCGIPATSIKGAIGHTMGAAGLLNALVAVEACRTGYLPPTATDGGSIIAGLDLIRGAPRAIRRGSPVLALAVGFGGNNIAVLFG